MIFQTYIDLNKFELRNARIQNLASAPSSPVGGQVYYNTADNNLYVYDAGATAWVDLTVQGGGAVTDATAGAKGVIQLAGDLSGTAAAPTVAAGAIDAGKVAGSLKPSVSATAGTESLRAIGTSANTAMAGNTPLSSVPAPTAAVDFNNQKGVNQADPTAAQDSATKAYVDSVAQGLRRTSARAATTANISLTGTQTVDTVALVANDRALVKNQTTTSQNGVYLVQSGAWTRAPDMDSAGEVDGAMVIVEDGTQAGTMWTTTSEVATLGTDAIVWTQFNSAADITAGAGLTRTGNSLDVGGTSNRITVAADAVDIAATYVGQASITTLGTVTTGTWNGTTIAVGNGGTGQTTAKAGRETGLGASGYYSSATHGAGTTISITQATHGLRASRGLVVQVQDEATGAVEFADVVVAASGDVTVTFGASQTANTKRVTIIG